MEEEKIPELTLEPNLTETPAVEVVKDDDLISRAAAAPEAGPDLSALSEQEQKAVLDFARQINLNDPNQVIQYGSAAQKNIADFSESALEKVKTKDMSTACC